MGAVRQRNETIGKRLGELVDQMRSRIQVVRSENGRKGADREIRNFKGLKYQ